MHERAEGPAAETLVVARVQNGRGRRRSPSVTLILMSARIVGRNAKPLRLLLGIVVSFHLRLLLLLLLLHSPLRRRNSVHFVQRIALRLVSEAQIGLARFSSSVRLAALGSCRASAFSSDALIR